MEHRVQPGGDIEARPRCVFLLHCPDGGGFLGSSEA